MPILYPGSQVYPAPNLYPGGIGSLVFASYADLEASVAVSGSWAAFTAFVVAGLATRQYSNALYYVEQYLGEVNVPKDVARLRRSVAEVMRRMGQPVIIKHMYNDHDARVGLAEASPSAFAGYGNQVRNRDPYSFGTGYCSIQLSPDEWITPNSGTIVTSTTSPGDNYVQAPFYRGYGPGFMTYLIEPDVPMDLFKLSPSGALIKTQSQTVVSGWFPPINDNDLIINVELDDSGHVVDTNERYQAKKTSPVSIRGLDRRGRREYFPDKGNRHVINQHLEMTALPESSFLYGVSADR